MPAPPVLVTYRARSVQVIFDCGLGDLYVVRVAGQVLDAAALGSVEHAVEQGAMAVVILGHEQCSAVAAAVTAWQRKRAVSAAAGGQSAGEVAPGPPSCVDAIINLLTPAVQAAADALVATGTLIDDVSTDDLVEAALRTNVALTAKSLTDRSALLAKRVRDGSVALAGFRYDINSPADEDGDGVYRVSGGFGVLPYSTISFSHLHGQPSTSCLYLPWTLLRRRRQLLQFKELGQLRPAADAPPARYQPRVFAMTGCARSKARPWACADGWPPHPIATGVPSGSAGGAVALRNCTA